MIVADPTEERHLPASLRELCVFVAGVEELTGADFIISPLSIPATSELLLLRHAKAGLCVQRKNMGDFVSSITDSDNRLWTQLARLHKVCGLLPPWLLLVGDLKCNREGMAIVDGRESGWEYGKLVAAIDWWQMRGGRYSWLSREGLISAWCKSWEIRLSVRDGENGWGEKMIVRPAQQTLYEVPPAVRTLMTYPGMGEERAMAVYRAAEKKQGEHDENRMITVQDLLLTMQDEKIEGIGKKTIRNVMKHHGWNEE